MNKKLMITLLAMMLVLVLISVMACSKKTEPKQEGTELAGTEKPVPNKTLKIGMTMPMSGPAGLLGTNVRIDADAYIALINEDGGLKIGDDYYNVEIYYTDNEGSVEGAGNATKDLVENKGVSAILGYWETALPTITSTTTPAKVITFAVGTSYYDPKTMPYTAFAFSTNHWGLVELGTIVQHFKPKKVGISTNKIYGDALAGSTLLEYKELLTEKGIVYFEDFYPWNNLDFTQHIEKLNKAGVDTIYSIDAPQPEAMKQKTIYELGYKDKMPFAGMGGVVDYKPYIDIAGYEAAQGGLHPHTIPWDAKLVPVAPEIAEMALRIKDKRQEMSGKEMNSGDSFVPLSAITMYFQALQKAGTTDPDEVMKVTEGGTFDLFTGTHKLGGLQTYGRAIAAAPVGPMGAVEGYTTKLVAEAPRYEIP